ncbi:isochorismate synthase [Sinomonas sp. ASV486]|uniref:isochorismate synthase n=1 Tax=Sinomonas sp. ASV486 TaxID=3051170 RepID=UPI0027DE1E34|nr:isochorismate synthase [Sinomonas sp. ASV486]MDQ4488623.1 isochorismate synthase [Sinomonas sp. ASV486]
MKHPLRALTIDLGTVDQGTDGLGTADLGTCLTAPDAYCWIRRGEGQVGFGEAARFSVTGPERFIEAEAWWKQVTLDACITDPVQHPGTGLLAFGSFAFSKTSRYLSRLIVPELVIGIRDGRGWATLVTNDGREPSEPEVRAAVVRVLASRTGAANQLSGGTTAHADSAGDGAVRGGAGPETAAAGPGFPETTLHGPVTLGPGALGEQRWMDAVSAGVARISAGDLEKLVLARDIVVTHGAPIERHEVLRRLGAAYWDTWVYGVDGLVGATPEMLIQVEGRTAQARVLAGTLDRREANGKGENYAERVLAGSPKQRHEHEIAIQSLTSALEPFSEAMNAHDEPFILELPNVFHLASDVKAELADVEGHVPTSLALVNALHPTAAVCGTPTSVAGALIRELEAMDRGPYAGPVGWLDAAGNGEWGIALRGGVIESPTAMRLYAGCGIVEGSQPAVELAETWAKFRPMLEALGIER